MRPLDVYRLGRVEYADGLMLQRLFAEAVRQKLLPDTLLLLEHPPVVTLGRSAKQGNILASEATLKQGGIEVFETDRGGDVTYHGPGQVVGYPILLLSPDRQDVRKYVCNLEECLIMALARFGIQAGRIPGWTGVWLGSQGGGARKIGAIGVHLSRWLTTHGFALNVSPDLSHFGLIVPCGIEQAGVTSIAHELGHPVEMGQVEQAVANAFCSVFECRRADPLFPKLRTISVTVVRERPEGAEVLLLRRSEKRGGFWQPVTGRVEEGESALEAASREVNEETGRPLSVIDLGYRHSFALGEEQPPRLVEESAFAAFWPDEAPARLDPREHDGSAWLTIEQAIERVPYAGLKRAIFLAGSLRRGVSEVGRAPHSR